MADAVTKRATNYAQWYLDIVKEAGRADNSPGGIAERFDGGCGRTVRAGSALGSEPMAE